MRHGLSHGYIFDAVYRGNTTNLLKQWHVVLERRCSQIPSAGFKISVRVCSVLGIKKQDLMLMKNYYNWNTTKWLSSPTKNLSVLPCFDMTHFGLGM